MGRLFGLYLVWYGAGRIVWESIRIDPSDIILGIRTNVWAAILAVALGVVIVIVRAAVIRRSSRRCTSRDAVPAGLYNRRTPTTSWT